MKLKKYLIFSLTILITFPLFSVEYKGVSPVWQSRITENLFVFRPLEFSSISIDPEFKRVFAGTEKGEIVAIDSKSGDILWRYNTRNPILHKPVIDGNSLIAGDSGGVIYSLDISKRFPNLIWKKQLTGGIISDLTLFDKKAFLLTDRNILYSIDIESGDIVYQINGDIYEGFTILSNTPVIIDGKSLIYTISTGDLFTLDIKDGKQLYKMNIFNPDEKLDGFTGLGTIGDHLFVTTLSGSLMCIEKTSGKIVWSRALSGITRMKVDESTSIIIICQSDGTISIYDTDGRIQVKKKPLNLRIVNLSIDKNRVIVAYQNGSIFILAKSDLTPITSFRLSSPVLADIAINPPSAYIYSSKGVLYKVLLE